MKCADCKHWKPCEQYETGRSQGMGRCEATPMFWDHTEWNDDCERVIKPAAASITAFVQDGSDYSATLYTRPEHGCTMFAAAGVALPQAPSMAEVIAAALDALEDNDNHAATVILKTAQRARGVALGALPQPLPKRLPTVTAALSMCREANSEARLPVPMAWDVALYVNALERAVGVALPAPAQPSEGSDA
jgi:hypothetical protein